MPVAIGVVIERLRWYLPLSLAVGMIFSLAGCSPTYVVRAGWEEAKILLGRESIEKLIESPNTDPETAEKFKLVISTRNFSETRGLKPAGSFTEFSQIDRDVLVWVLSATPKTSLKPVTWWFPIVGRVPYKGFFDKEDAVNEGQKLKKKGFDIYLRPSAAFSTLGWFDDPLLSTMLNFDELSLVDTILHEILHNTVWIKNHVAFNESLANFVGSIGSREFYTQRDGRTSSVVAEAEARWQEELIYARFLEDLVSELQALYSASDQSQDSNKSSELLKKREEVYKKAKLRWQSFRTKLKTSRYDKLVDELNNAVILAHRVYLNKPWLFEKLYEAEGSSLPQFVKRIKSIHREAKEKKKDPYDQLKSYLEKHGKRQIVSPQPE